MGKNFNWIEIARSIQAISQTGLAFSENDYDRVRYIKLTGIASKIIEAHTGILSDEIDDIFLCQKGYATPKIDVRAATVKEGKILLVKELADNKWSMPGGWADVGDRPAEVAIRETQEESGYIVKPKKVVGVFDANRSGRPMELFHAFKIIFLCDLMGGEPKISNETTDVGFFDFENIPELSSNRTNEKHLKEISMHLEDNFRPAFFE